MIFLAVIGASLDFLVLDRAQAQVFQESQRVATNWLGSFQPGSTPPRPIPKTRINLLQLIDSHGRVVSASAAAAGRPALSTLRPPVDDRIQDDTQCSPQGGCVMLSAVRLSPLETRELWHGEPHFVYAGMVQPPILATHHLEFLTAAGILLTTGLVAGGNWWVGGRSLRPVAAIRATMEEITVSDLSLRVPEPSGRTEYALLARTANQTLARLEEAVKQQRRFASTTSHELRTPLTGLHTRLEEAVLYPDDVDPHETIQEALSITRRLETIVDDLLVLARLRAGDAVAHEPIDLGALVAEEAASQMGGVPVHVHVDRDVTVQGNRIQLIRVFDNLLANARRHADTRIEATANRAAGQAVVTVTDDGAGIAPQDRERVFERFVRLDEGRRREPGGSGLGLAISRDIAHAHNGTLRVEDSPRGARFVLRLPLMDAIGRLPTGEASSGALHVVDEGQTPAWRI
ncbi:cell wall metabolism sensor histidine kinase WalK [Streptosporangium sp. 'caverna']|uniref:sensor histidine kinase n=1 Tax=Streptosporangium sp. 'caverna' TaxID=2202249 RepID=UPI0013A6AEF9|nr:HAMP domain-containing sensor histidine kinase [Streptosporangium sp. 'caverna']